MILVIHCKFLIVLSTEQASYRFVLFLFFTWPNLRAQKIRRTLAVFRTKPWLDIQFARAEHNDG